MHAHDRMIARLTVHVAEMAHVPRHRVRLDAHLVTELGLDSLDLLCLHAWAEEEFAARFDDDRLAELTTIGAIARVLREHWDARRRWAP